MEAAGSTPDEYRALMKAEIERRTGKLVVTTNQATIWRTLKKIGINRTKPGFGRLLAEVPPIEDPA